MTTIFTDGAARGNPGPGGWGSIIVFGDTVLEIGGVEDYTTNNRMELLAVISALEKISKEKEDIIIYTDSAYVASGSTRWVYGWEKNNWKTSQKADVLNRDLWERILKLTKNKKIDWRILKGHSGIAPNERCDVIATSFADKKNIVLYFGAKERYGVNLVIEEQKQLQAKPPSRVYAYSYVSEVGGHIQTHKNWLECKSVINKVSGARFKKAKSKEEEEQIIEEFKKPALKK